MTKSLSRLAAIEIDSEFEDKFREIAINLAQAEHDLVLYTDGLSILEKKLMYKVDEEYYKQHSKRLPEYAQRRDAKRHPRYTDMVRAKAAAARDRSLYRTEKDIYEMRFKEWQTRSVDRRNSV